MVNSKQKHCLSNKKRRGYKCEDYKLKNQGLLQEVLALEVV
jgi:hypothetical protein